MKLVIFGLTVSSSWGNGHATLWRGLWRALARRGHRIVFFERDVPYYASQRDVASMPGGDLVLYPDWAAVLARAKRELFGRRRGHGHLVLPRRHRGIRPGPLVAGGREVVLRHGHAGHASSHC
jgi:hypothetical protein